MSKRRSEQVWEIYRLASKAVYLGKVTAPDEDTAIRIAIKQFPVSNPDHQKRLIARKAS